MPQPGALTMGWDVQPEPAASPTPASPTPAATPATGARMPQQPGALTMGWDAVPDPTAPAPAPATGARNPQQPGALTMGWDVPEEAAQQAVSPAALAAKSVATTHTISQPAPGKSPQATLLGMQAPWTKPSAPTPAASQAPQQQYAPPQMPPGSPTPNAQQQPSTQYAPPQMPHDAPSTVHVAPEMMMPQPAPQPTAPPPAAAPSTTLQTRASGDGLDKPPKNMLPIYALIGVIVIAAAIVAVVLLTQ
jgi:hypothetical protein